VRVLGQLQAETGPDEIWTLQNRAAVANACLTDIQIEEVAIALLILEEIRGDRPHRVTALHHVPARIIRPFDDARVGSGIVNVQPGRINP
jgi:hypothetical protein